MKTKIFSVMFVFLFLMSFVSAGPLMDKITEESGDFSRYELSDEVCSYLQYRILMKIINNFSFEISSVDSTEHFYLKLGLDNCAGYVEILEDYPKRPDVSLVLGLEGNNVVPESFKLNTLKGIILYGFLKDKVL